MPKLSTLKACEWEIPSNTASRYQRSAKGASHEYVKNCDRGSPVTDFCDIIIFSIGDSIEKTAVIELALGGCVAVSHFLRSQYFALHVKSRIRSYLLYFHK